MKKILILSPRSQELYDYWKMLEEQAPIICPPKSAVFFLKKISSVEDRIIFLKELSRAKMEFHLGVEKDHPEISGKQYFIYPRYVCYETEDAILMVDQAAEVVIKVDAEAQTEGDFVDAVSRDGGGVILLGQNARN